MTPADPALIEGASVGELLQQVEDQFYLLAVQPPSARALLSAWPDFAASSAHLLRAVIGPGADQHATTTTNPAVHPVVPAAVRLMQHLDRTFPTWGGVVPDPALLRAAKLLGAAADLVEADRDRRHGQALLVESLLQPNPRRAPIPQPPADPGLTSRDLTDADRLAAILRVSQHAQAGVQLIATISGRARANRAKGTASAEQLGQLHVENILQAGMLAARVLSVGNGHPVLGGYDQIRVPTLDLVDPTDLLARFRFSVHAWKQASLASAAQRPSVAEVLRSTVEIRHLIGLNAALIHAASATGQIPTARANEVLGGLLATQRAWQAAADRLIGLTDGVTAGPEHVAASMALADSVRAITRSPDGGWRPPEDIAGSVPLAEALVAARTALHEAMEVARVQQALTTRLILLGGLHARARAVPLTPDRVEARVRDGYVPITLDEATGLRKAQAAAIDVTDRARRQVALMELPDDGRRAADVRQPPLTQGAPKATL